VAWATEPGQVVRSLVAKALVGLVMEVKVLFGAAKSTRSFRLASLDVGPMLRAQALHRPDFLRARVAPHLLQSRWSAAVSRGVRFAFLGGW
jgi:hypothetical protein